MRSVSLQHDWIMHADMDEHHVYPKGSSVVDFLRKCEKRGVTVVMGHYRDRVALFVSIVCLYA